MRPRSHYSKQPLIQKTAQIPDGPLELDVYPGDDCRGEIYLDDGVSILGPSLSQTIRCTVTKTGLALDFGPRRGSYRPWWKMIKVTIRGAAPITKIIPDQPRSATIAIRGMTGHPRARLALFAFGDFAFNLYWQSIMLFLLFYYTDALEIPISWAAATCDTIASIWDGIANFAAGVLVGQGHDCFASALYSLQDLAPLGVTFVLTICCPLQPGHGRSSGFRAPTCCSGHAMQRSMFPISRMSARISPSSSDRAFVAGMRMMFGTGAVVLVALATVPLGRTLTGSIGAHAYFASALVFAVVDADLSS